MYAFATVHVCGMLYKEYGLLMAEGKQIKSKDEIFQLLITIWNLRKSSLSIVKGTKRVKDTVTLGNHKADKATKLVAE